MCSKGNLEISEALLDALDLAGNLVWLIVLLVAGGRTGAMYTSLKGHTDTDSEDSIDFCLPAPSALWRSWC